MGYCPIVLQKEMKLYCNTVIVLQRRRLEGWKFYCNTADSIARMCSWLGGIVLQEGQLYCNRGNLAAEGTVLQYSLVGSRFVLQYKLYCEHGVGLCRDTARARQLGTLGASGARTGGAGRAQGALGARQGRWRAARARSRRRRHWRGTLGQWAGCWARSKQGTYRSVRGAREAQRTSRLACRQALGRAAGAGGAQACGRGARGGRLGAPVHSWVPAGPVLVLVHLAWFSTWFFDSVFFLSH